MGRPSAGEGGARLLALDWLRGFVMVVMAVDHCDAATNPGHAAGDSVWMGRPGPLVAADFLTRWATHLCAPTFVFLSGAGMALSIAHARARGDSAAATDRHWLLRALVLFVLEVTLLSFYWRFEQPVDIVLQVLYAIAGGLALLVVLRRLPQAVRVGAALLLPWAAEWCFEPVRWPQAAAWWNGLSVSGGFYRLGGDGGISVFALYPLLPWLPAMLLGHAFGDSLARGLAPRAVARRLAAAGVLALAAFAAVRGANAFGNMRLLRRDGSLLEWLHCSKYPPSASFLLLELGLMALLLAALCALAARRRGRALRFDPLVALGRVPLFYYVLHLPLIGALVYSGLFPRPGSAARSWLMAAVVAALALPLCTWYARYKQRRRGWTRFL